MNFSLRARSLFVLSVKPKFRIVAWNRGDLPSQNYGNIFFQVDSTVEFRTKMVIYVSTCPFLQPILHHRSIFQIASNDFGIHLVHRILRPMVKRWAQSDQQFNSYGTFWCFLGRFWENFPKNTITPKLYVEFEVIQSTLKCWHITLNWRDKTPFLVRKKIWPYFLDLSTVESTWPRSLPLKTIVSGFKIAMINVLHW